MTEGENNRNKKNRQFIRRMACLLPYKVLHGK